MTIIAWDGKMMAADKLNFSHTIGSMTKIRKINNMLVGCSGRAVFLPVLFEWAANNFAPDLMPAFQKEEEGYLRVMCVTPGGEIRMYENFSTPWINEAPFASIGSAAEIALGAMAAGANAVKAVEIASKYGALCGNGCDTLVHDVVQKKRALTGARKPVTQL